MTLFEKCVMCHEDQLKYIMKQPCPNCKTIYFCSLCLHSYFNRCSTSCCQCKKKNIDLYQMMYMIYLDYVIMLFNCVLYFCSSNDLHSFILCSNYVLCTSMLLRLIRSDVRLLDYFNILSNVLLSLFVKTDFHILQMTYIFYVVFYVIQKF